MAINFLNNIDLNKNQIIEPVIHTLAGSAPSSPSGGQLYYDSTDGNLYVYDGVGTSWVDLTSQGAGSTNITVVEGASTVEIQSSTGSNDSIAAATTSLAGVMTAADKTKLDAITGTNTGDQTITLTGDVTGTGTGSFATTISNNAVTLGKFQQITTDSFLGRDSAGTGNVEILSVATAKTLLGLSGTNTGDQTITLTGDVTGSGTGSFAATIANDSVTLAKMANVATSSVFYRKTAGTGDPEVQTLATLKTDLGLTGTNSGDQTITLTGDVTGSGTGSFATTIANNAVEAGMLNTNVISGQATALTSGLVGTDELLISDGGTIKKMDVSVMNAYFDANLNFTNNTGTVTGTGTAGTLPVWSTGGTGIEDSIVSQSGGTLFVSGNLDVSGTTTTIDSTTVAIGDNMMKFAKDNSSNVSDIGWYGVINDGTAKYTGMWYDASTGTTTPKFALGIATTEPAATGTIVTTGTLVADLEGNASTATTWETARDLSLTGDVTATISSVNGSANASGAATIANNAVTLAKMADVATSTVFYRKTAGTGDPETQTLSTLKTDLGLTGTNSGDQTITLTGDVTGTGTGSFAATIANDAVTYAKIQNVVANNVFLGNDNGAGSAVQELTVAEAKVLLNLSGTNSGDEASASTTVQGVVELATSAETITGTDTTRAVTPDGLAATKVVSSITIASLLTGVAEINHAFGTEDISVELYDGSTGDTVYADVTRGDISGLNTTNYVTIGFGVVPTAITTVDVVIHSHRGATSVSPAYS